MKMSLRSRKELVKKSKGRHLRSSKIEKTKILDELVKNTELDRNYLIQMMSAKIDLDKIIVINRKRRETYDANVIHVRKALNGYLAGTNEGIDMPEVVIEKNMEGDAATGLASFDKSYYESKFIVMDVTDAAFGGKNIGLLFQDKPDKAFTAWVYKVPGENEGEEGYYDLRGFWENPGMLKNVEFLLEEHKELVFDKEHCL